MATTASTSTSTTPTQEESDYDSSCSSITVLESGQSWISDLSFGSRSSSVSVCSYSTTDTTQLSYGHQKPHKANHLAWEAMKRLRDEKGRVGLDHFRLLRRLGNGDLGNVYLCQLRNTPVGLRQAHCFYAMKVVDREALAFRNKLQRAEMEREILGMLDHPFLPTLYAEFDASHYSCLVMEFCPGGDLHAVRLRQPSKRFSISSAKFYAAETLLALEYLHMMGIVYRDLKPENVLVREDGHIMLSDFDLSLKCDVVPKLLRSIMNNKNSTKSSSSIPSCASPIQPVLSCFLASNSKKKKNKNKNKNQEEATGNKVEVTNDEEDLEEINGINPELVAEPINARSKSFVGTHEYLAPEVISGLGHGSAVDWWTFGVFLYEMIYGITPFKGENNEKTLINIIKKPLTFPSYTASRMIIRDMEELTKAQDLIGKLLVKNPKKRIGSLKGSAEIKRHEFFKGVNWALIRSVKPPEVPRDFQKVMGKSLLPKSSKQEKGATYQIPPHHHFDYF